MTIVDQGVYSVWSYIYKTPPWYVILVEGRLEGTNGRKLDVPLQTVTVRRSSKDAVFVSSGSFELI